MNDQYDPIDIQQFGDGFDLEQPQADGFDLEDYDGYEPLDAEAAGEEFDGFDAEADAFFKKAFRKIGGALKKGIGHLRKLAPIAGKIAGGFFGGPVGAKIGGQLGGMLQEDEGFDGYEQESFDFEEFDSEDESMEQEPLREDQPQSFNLDPFTDALAEELAASAADSESDAEASALLGGVTIHIMSRAPVTVKRLSPVIVRSASRLGRFLRRNRRTRTLVRAIPTIERRAVKMLTKRAERGDRVTPLVARKAMAKATYNTLRSPRAVAKGIANNAVKRVRAQRISRKAVARAERQQAK
jgi:hypothetical protein